jgi:hypothetical protein
MSTTAQTRKGAEKILAALAEFDYFTAEQLTRLLYAPNSISFVRKKLNALTAAGFVLALPRRSVTLPRVYTLTSTGSAYTAALGIQDARRVRSVDERDKARNLLFIEHSLAVSDVLISARLLSQTHPGIALTRMYTERQLKRKSMPRYLRKPVLSRMPVASFGLRRPGTKNPKRGRISFTLRSTAICRRLNGASSKRSKGTWPIRQPASMRHYSQRRPSALPFLPISPK